MDCFILNILRIHVKQHLNQKNRQFPDTVPKQETPLTRLP